MLKDKMTISLDFAVIICLFLLFYTGFVAYTRFEQPVIYVLIYFAIVIGSFISMYNFNE